MTQVQGGNPAAGFSMIAPAQSSGKRDDVKLLNQGVNLGILYSMIDLGTHENKLFKKRNRMIRFTFEFPMLKQLFRVDDTEPRSTVVSKEISFQMAPKSNLKKFCEGALGRPLEEHEYKRGYDVAQFLGKMMIVNIVNKPSKKDPSVIYNNIDTVSGITEQSRAVYNFDWNNIQRTQELQGFMIGDGSVFATERFAQLPEFIRNKIKESDEAIAWAQRGGTFAEPTDSNSTQPIQPVQPVQPVQQTIQREVMPPVQQAPSVPGVKKFVYTNTEFSYEVMKANGWTDDLLVTNGYAVWEMPAPPPAPVAPQVPQAPMAPPVPVAPQAPAIPQAPPVLQTPVAAQQLQQPQQPVSMSFDANGNPVDFTQDVDGLQF